MLLNDYLEKLKTKKLDVAKNSYISDSIVTDDFIADIYPDDNIEEWKNFNIKAFKKRNWSIFNRDANTKVKKVNLDYENLILFNNGILEDVKLEKHLNSKIKVYKISECQNKGNNIFNKIYNDRKKYSERRLSGIDDDKTTKLLVLNKILSDGIVIEVSPDTKINKEICIINNISTELTLISPYIFIIVKDRAKINFLDLTVYEGNQNWTNVFYEIYLEKAAEVKIANLNLEQKNNLNTASFNFHIEEYANLLFSLINKGFSKKDVRVFLNGKSSKANIKGILLSKQEEFNDVFCKITHNEFQTDSNQDWRMISSDNSKSSLNGKIRILKNAKNSSGKFLSKSLLLDNKAKSFSKPELEIFEDEVTCSHGASFGEIEKEKVFYLQSRGLSKKDAIRTLIAAFLNELEIEDSFFKKDLIKEIDSSFFK